MFKYNKYRGAITLADNLSAQKQKCSIDWDGFVIPSERGKQVDEYMKQMRDNDRSHGLEDEERTRLPLY